MFDRKLYTIYTYNYQLSHRELVGTDNDIARAIDKCKKSIIFDGELNELQIYQGMYVHGKIPVWSGDYSSIANKYTPIL